jgi:hypothetical protein
MQLRLLISFACAWLVIQAQLLGYVTLTSMNAASVCLDTTQWTALETAHLLPAIRA